MTVKAHADIISKDPSCVAQLDERLAATRVKSMRLRSSGWERAQFAVRTGAGSFGGLGP